MSDDPSWKVVDLSYKDLSFVPIFVSDNRRVIEHLILDGNELTEAALNLPHFANLQTLSLNKNQIRDVECLLSRLSVRCPNLKHLSLIGNPGWPHPVTANEPQLYEKYRAHAAKLLPRLQFLDSTPIKAYRSSEQSDSRSLDNCTYKKVQYVYTGAASEGNRFISDKNL